MALLGEAFVRVRPDTKGFEAEAESKVKGAFSRVGKAAVLGMAAAGAGAVAAGVKLFEHGSQLQAMANKADTVFGSQIGAVEKWAKANANAMGLSSREATGLAANFGDLLIPMGFTREAAAKMSTDVVGLSGALSQWSGGTISASEASDVLAKAMLGEREGLKALGISITEADVQAQLLKNGTEGLTGAALEQAKATATQELIFAKSTDAQAAYAEGGNKLQLAQNTLKAKLKEVFDEVSVRLIPVFNRLSEWILTTGIPAAERLWTQFNVNVLPILKDVASFVTGTMVPALQDFGSWINRNKDFLIPFVAIVGTAVAGFKLYAAIQKVVTAVTAAWNAVLLMNPIGLVVIALAALAAGLVVAYQRSETFRNIVDGAFRAVSTAASFMWDEVLKPAFAAMVDTFLLAAETIVGAAATAFGWVPGIGGKLKTAAAEIATFRDDANRALDGIKDKTITVRLKTEGMRDAAAAARNAARGDGPGAGGKTLSRIMPILNRLGGYVTSTYRSPAQNRAVGGSPTSFHMDKNNPAVDIGGPTGTLDKVHAALRAAGGWRELLWRVPNHYDHVHVADQGGVFRGPGMVWMGAGQETFASGLAAKKVSDLPTTDNSGALIDAMHAVVDRLESIERRVDRLVPDYTMASRAGAF